MYVLISSISQSDNVPPVNRLLKARNDNFQTVENFLPDKLHVFLVVPGFAKNTSVLEHCKVYSFVFASLFWHRLS